MRNAVAPQFGKHAQIDVGQLCRQAFGDEVYIIRQGTDRSTVAAATGWEGSLSFTFGSGRQSAGSSNMTMALAQTLMDEFATATGILRAEPPRRYLWTDAYAVCNFLELARNTGDDKYLDLARRLVDQVHFILGRHRDDDSRRGWISGLSEQRGISREVFRAPAVFEYHNAVRGFGFGIANSLDTLKVRREIDPARSTFDYTPRAST